MELFISSNLSESKLSLTLQFYTTYLRAQTRKIVNLVPLTQAAQSALKITNMPVLVRTGAEAGSSLQTANPFSIMLQIAQGVYLEDIMVGKPKSIERQEIMSFIELAMRLEPAVLAQHLNKHLEMKMFAVGHSISAADITLLVALLEYFAALPDYEKLELPHTFRWVDHVQHLPGILEQVQLYNLFVTFPDENIQAPSKSQLKKMAKQKGKGGAPPTEEAKKETQAPDQKTQQPKKEKQQQQKQQNQPKKPAQKKEEPTLPDISYMDIRVGKIVEVWPNPNSDKLYNEKVDIGNGEIRCIASGLQKIVPLEGMMDKLVVVLCNLKPKKLADYVSHGMVLCAETPDRSQIELMCPPEGSLPGDIISFPGYERQPPEQLHPKKNPWDTVQPKLKIDDKGVACYESAPFTTSKGTCKSKTITNGIIH